MSMHQCANGHWYDDAKYSKCPYCTGSPQTAGAAASGDEEGRTVAFYDTPAPDNSDAGDGGQEKRQEERRQQGDYISGWLVCTDGPDKGTDYRIFHGRNFVGRDFSMDIVIRGDSKVSRERHCCIVYDKKSNQTFLVPENGRTVEYHGAALTEPVKLENYDTFIIGDSTMAYVAFCEGERRWT